MIKSKEYFIDTVIANHGDIYLFDKTEYVGSNEYVKIGCKKHNHYFTVKSVTLLRRTERNGGKKKNPVVGSCPICREEYFEEIKNDMLNKYRLAHNNEYEYKNFINITKPFTAICKIHGEFTVYHESHIKGRGKCKACHHILRGRKPHPNIKYINEQKYYICNIHGDVPVGKNRKLYQGCPECNKIKNKKRRNDSFINTLNEKYGDKYNIVVTEKYVEFICKEHGTITIVDRNDSSGFNNIHYCNICRGVITREEFKEKCIKIINEEYDNYEFLKFIENDDLNKCKIKLRILSYDSIKTVRAKHIYYKGLSRKGVPEPNHMNFEEAKTLMLELGITCFRQYRKWHKRTKQIRLPANPYRGYRKDWISYYDFFSTDIVKDMSAGELRIKNYLERKNIEYEFQKTFDDCRNINLLRFDFYLPKYNLIIEFDGYQHYENVEKFGNTLSQIKKHDKIKNKYCKDNSINIIRIPYWELEDNVVEWTLDNEITRVAAERHF